MHYVLRFRDADGAEHTTNVWGKDRPTLEYHLDTACLVVRRCGGTPLGWTLVR